LTPDDIAEIIVFAAGRRENVVIADTLVFPSHQVGNFLYSNHNHHANKVGGGGCHAQEVIG
jgi:hypothetical protein